MIRRHWSVVACIIGLLAVSTALWAAENILKATNKPESWRLEEHEKGKGKMQADGDAILFEVTEVDGEDWHVQAFQTPLDLKENGKYKLTFSAKAEPQLEIRVQAGIDEEDWHMIDLDETITVGKEWKKYELPFSATDVKANKNRVGFVLGGAKGKLWVKDCVLSAQ